MPRDSKVYLEDVVAAAEKIRRYVSDLTEEQFSVNDLVVDAVARNLEVIGEAVKHVPDHVRGRCPEIEWKKIAGLRDILIHQYFGMNLAIIWEIVRDKVPELLRHVTALLDDWQSNGTNENEDDE